MYDQTRIDHFRAFAGYWAVAATEETAINGVWRKGPGRILFDRVRAKLGAAAPFIMAEDLGVITPDVKELRRSIEAPGMVVLQFAWGGGPDNTHLPHNHYANSFAYPGTHDNETTVGWYKDSATVRAAASCLGSRHGLFVERLCRPQDEAAHSSLRCANAFAAGPAARVRAGARVEGRTQQSVLFCCRTRRRCTFSSTCAARATTSRGTSFTRP